jgi:putative hydrolase of the HAD superfamily
MEGVILARMLQEDVEETSALMRRIFYGEIFEFFSGIQPFPGLREALSGFRSSGLPLAILSDMPPERKLELMGLSSSFDLVHCSEDSGFLKPDPSSFLRLAKALSREPGEILYIGNNPRYDLAGARNAGMQAAILSRRAIRGADFRFGRWENLVRFVKESQASS